MATGMQSPPPRSPLATGQNLTSRQGHYPSMELSRLKRIRGSHRAMSKRLNSAVEELLESGLRGPELVERSEQLKFAIEEKIRKLEDFDDQIISKIEEELIPEEVEASDNYRELLQLALIRIQSNLSNKAMSTIPSNLVNASSQENDAIESGNQDLRPNMSTTTPQQQAATADARVVHLNLPKLDLVKFSGDLSQWSTFWDTFDASINSNGDLAAVEKFNYLNSLLEGTARESIRGLSLTSANYQEAVSILKKRFGNKQMIINRHMEILLNFETISSGYNLKGIRQLYDSVEAQVRSLKSLGVPSSSYGNLLASVLMNKIPSELRLIVSREMGDSDWELDRLLQFICTELEARERALDLSRQSNHISTTTSRPVSASARFRNQTTASALLTTDSNRLSCTYCHQPHPSNKCTNVTSIEARRSILRRDKRCYVCLRKDHMSYNCDPNKRCPRCQEHHHISICEARGPNVPINNKHSLHQRYSQPSPSYYQQSRFPAFGSQVRCPVSQQTLSHRFQNNQPAQPSQRFQLNRNTEGSTWFQGNQGNFHGQVETTQSSLSMFVNSSTAILLPTARAVVFNPTIYSARLEVRMIFDSGSQRTYITRAIQDYLCLPVVEQRTFMIKTFGSAFKTPQTLDVVSLHIKTNNGDIRILAIVVPFICDKLCNQSLDRAQNGFPHLRNLKFADYNGDQNDLMIDMLIGSDEYWNFVTGEVVRGERGPTGLNTILGWVLFGPMSHTTRDESSYYPEMISTNFISSSEADQSLQEDLEKFWNLESLGIESRSLFEQHIDKIKFKKNRYEVELPWKSVHPRLPDNFELSLGRLKNLLRKLKRENLLQEYNQVMVDQINQGIVEKVEDPSQGQPGKIYFVPHHPVIRRDKTTTKLRIVYDASSKQQPDLPSLNDCLLAGPPLTENILDILLRFRVHRIALAGDIEKAFLMVSVAPKDRDVLRFLWFDNPEDENPNFTVYRFTRVMFGVSSSPFLLNATVRYHIEQFMESNPEFVKNVLRSIYVDDLSTGSDDVETTYQLYEDAKERFATGGFNLRKFVTNSSELRERIQVNESRMHPGNQNITSSPIHEEDETYTKFILGNSTSNEDQKILGIKWNFIQDNFVIDWSEVLQLAQNIVPTKRLVVSVSSKFYDPMGFLSPFIVQFKLLFQDLCKCGVRWDDILEEEHLSKWRRLIESARNMKPILVSRCYFQNIQEPIISCHLHGYCDSSSKAYAAVVYLKIVTTTSIYVRFLSSKTRIAPINSQTIPRLELLSALILARLVNTIQKALECELQIDGIQCWTDSKVAYYWIRHEEREWKQFIQNRVEEIRKLVSASSFNHCPGLQNPADIPSRGMNPFEFVNNSLWIKGPEWLINFEESMPYSNEDLDLPEECLIEMKVKDRNNIKCQVESVMVAVENYGIANVISCQDYSNLHRLLRVTANVLKFVNILKSRFNKVPVNKSFSQYVLEAQALWIKEVQGQLVNHSNFETWKRQLDVYEDDKGVLRCRGRLGNSQLTISCKFPALLDPSHYFTSLVVISCHKKVLHNGIKETLTELRSNYWIIRGRQYVRKLIHQCVTCRKYEGKPYQPPSTPPLPDFRVQKSPPFAYVGVDFAGPLFVKTNGTTEQHKVWLCLFTCCSTRAVHLDVVPDLFTTSFLRCFQRLTARRGYPVQVISDNGKTFKSAAKLLQDKLVWSFNVEKAPWWGGIFERMIQSVKRCLKKTIGGAKLSYDELVTVVIEIEAVLNSRPISFVSTEDVEEPLTPSHLIHGRRILNVPDDVNDKPETRNLNQEDMRRRVCYVNQTLDHFWRRWSSEYLLELRNRYAIKAKSGPKVSIGDVVTVHNENLPRCRWRIGRVIELIPGKDKNIRAVKLKVRAANGQINIIQRPVQKLYPLETSHSETNPVINTSDVDNSDPVIDVSSKQSTTDDPDPVVQISDSSPQRSDPNPPVSNSGSQRPRRVAAQESDRRRKQWIKDLMS